MQTISQPADGQCLAAACRMVDEIFPPHMTGRRKLRQRIVSHLPHHAALVIPWKNRISITSGLICLRLNLRRANEEERQCLKQLVLRQHLTVQKLYRIFAAVLRNSRIRQPHVMPAEVLPPARVSCSHYISSIGSKVEKRVPENLASMVACRELRYRIVYILVLFVLNLQRNDGQSVEKEYKINFLIGLAEVEMGAKSYAILAVFRSSDTLSRARLRIIKTKFQSSHLETMAHNQP